jgi:hypothetical protein
VAIEAEHQDFAGYADKNASRERRQVV